MTNLEKEIASTLNRFSAENTSDTPDFILAAYLIDCLKAFNRASVWRGKWYSHEGVPASERDSGPEVGITPSKGWSTTSFSRASDPQAAAQVKRNDPSAKDLDAVAEELAVSGEVFPTYASWTDQERALLGQDKASDKPLDGPGLTCRP